MGGWGWNRCTGNRVLSHVARNMASFWFGAVDGHCAQNLGLLGGLLGAVCGHIVELEGPRRSLGTWKSSCMCTVATISIHLAVFSTL